MAFEVHPEVVGTRRYPERGRPRPQHIGRCNPSEPAQACCHFARAADEAVRAPPTTSGCTVAFEAFAWRFVNASHISSFVSDRFKPCLSEHRIRPPGPLAENSC